MNEVARCTQIALGIAAAAPPGGPVALVDLGTGPASACTWTGTATGSAP